nr:uncharacterized protein LOC111505466 [Leptinotarsa decemlineata]XP_023016044.1 uncharacterized protein LOC111505466 [Leptinotarsa decemlineata]
MNSFSVPESVFARLKCHICKGYLSVSPVSGSQGRYTCGRCEPSKYTNQLYEELAKHLSFPCIHESCTKKLTWDEVANHEMVCPHKPITCPIPDCSFKMESRMVSSHFKILHENLRHTDNIKAVVGILKNIAVPLETVYCVDFRETCYLVFVRLNNSIDGNSVRYRLKMGVFSLSESYNQNIKYRVSLELQSSKETTRVDKQQLSIPTYKDQLHCFQCLNKECTRKGHRNAGDFFTAKFTGLDSSNNMCVTFSVKLYDTTEVNLDKKLHSNNAGIAVKLECPICSIYMCAPIFNCPKGHSVCSSCRKSIKNCPLCKSIMGESRNYILEEISESVEIPCHNAELGCQFSGLVRDTIEHENNCSIHCGGF